VSTISTPNCLPLPLDSSNAKVSGKGAVCAVHGPTLPWQELNTQNLLRNQGLGLALIPGIIPLHFASSKAVSDS